MTHTFNVRAFVSGRLGLVPCTDMLARSAVGDGGAVYAATGAYPADGWPSPEGASYLRTYAALFGRDPSMLGWGPWLVVTDKTVVGEVGFKGKPSRGSVEIGYGVAPLWRGRRIAGDAVCALVEWAFARRGVDVVVAQCRPDNAASIKVLERVGMRRCELSGAPELLRWELWKRR